MIDILFKILKTKTVTKQWSLDRAAEGARGRIEILKADSPALFAAVEVCPTGALFIGSNGKVSLFHGNCVFCGACARVCGADVLQQTNEYQLAAIDKRELYENQG